MPTTRMLALASRRGCEALSSGVISDASACGPVVIRTTIFAADGLDCDICCPAAANALSIRLEP